MHYLMFIAKVLHKVAFIQNNLYISDFKTKTLTKYEKKVFISFALLFRNTCELFPKYDRKR